MAPSTSSLLFEWNWQPSVIIGLVALAVGYAYLVGPMRRNYNLGPHVSGRQYVYFALSELTVAVALLSPIDRISDDYLFTMHMVQHLLLAGAWPPLVLMAIPPWAVRKLFSRAALGGVLGLLTRPGVALTLFFVDLYVWHLPVLYDAALNNEGIHIVEHLCFMVTAVLNWWPVLSPVRSQRMSYPFQLLYLFVSGTLMMILGIMFTFSPFSFYPPYQIAPRLWGLTPVNDQQLGGLIMWYAGNIPYAWVFAVAFYRWFEGDPTTRGDEHVISQASIPYNDASPASEHARGAR